MFGPLIQNFPLWIYFIKIQSASHLQKSFLIIPAEM